MDSDDILSNEYQTSYTPVLTWRATPHFGIIAAMFRYLLPLLLFDLSIGLLWKFRMIYTLQSVFVVYTTNFIAFPLLMVVWNGWKLARQRLVGQNCFSYRRMDEKQSHPTWGTGRETISPYRSVVQIGLSCGLLTVFGYATFIEPAALQVKRVEIASAKVTTLLTILHISDIQTNSVGWYERKAFRMMQELQPDLILHTGDLVQIRNPQQRERAMQELAALFRQLTPRYGVYDVFGDTEQTRDAQFMQRFAALSGATVLADQSLVLQTHAGPVHLFGLDLPTSARLGSKLLIERWQRQAPDDAFTIVLGHRPDYVLDSLDLPIDLCLAGHTHGGQVRLPFVGPLVTFSRIPKAWAMGFREVGKLRLNVSAGIGSEHAAHLPAIRFNCPPAMTLLLIKPSHT